MNVPFKYFKKKIKELTLAIFKLLDLCGKYSNYKRVFMVIKSNLKSKNFT